MIPAAESVLIRELTIAAKDLRKVATTLIWLADALKATFPEASVLRSPVIREDGELGASAPDQPSLAFGFGSEEDYDG